MKIRWLVVSLAAVVALVLSGCASVESTPEQMRAATATYQLPKQPEAGAALVYIVFPEDWSGLQFDVYLDGQTSQSAIGYNRGGQYIYLSVPPGEHKIYSREHGNTSKGQGWTDFTFTASAGDILFLRQEMVLGWVDVENRLKALPPDEGKYYVKTTNTGKLLKGELQPAQAAAPAAQLALLHSWPRPRRRILSAGRSRAGTSRKASAFRTSTSSSLSRRTAASRSLSSSGLIRKCSMPAAGRWTISRPSKPMASGSRFSIS